LRSDVLDVSYLKVIQSFEKKALAEQICMAGQKPREQILLEVLPNRSVDVPILLRDPNLDAALRIFVRRRVGGHGHAFRVSKNSIAPRHRQTEGAFSETAV
jgi:hypothetical protein